MEGTQNGSLESRLGDSKAAHRRPGLRRGIRAGCWRCDVMSITLAPALPPPTIGGRQLSLVMPAADTELDVTLPAQRQMLHLTEADVLVLPSGVQGTIHCEAGSTAVSIELGGALCTPLSDAHERPRTFVGTDRFLTATAQMLQGRLEAGWSPGRDYLISLARLIAVHVRHMPHNRRHPMQCASGLPRYKLRTVKDLIDERLCGTVEVRELSDTIGMSPAHFSRVFKQATGYSPYVYVTLRRVRRARELMVMSDANATDAAAAVGLRTARRLASMTERFIVPPFSSVAAATCPDPVAVVKAG